MNLKKIMSNPQFQIILNLIRIGTFIMIGFLILYMIKEVEAVKLLAYDACDICVSKSGCTCWCIN